VDQEQTQPQREQSQSDRKLWLPQGIRRYESGPPKYQRRGPRLLLLLLLAILIIGVVAYISAALLFEYNYRLSGYVFLAAIAAVMAIVLLLFGYAYDWTGFRDKKLWDWLELLSALAIPIVLAAAGFWFTTQQDKRQQKIEALRAKSEHRLERQRAQDTALQTYLDQMGPLILEKNLRKSADDSEVRMLARARTLSVLGRVDASGKVDVMQFLVDAALIQKANERSPIIELDGARLSGADLTGIDLNGAHLDGAHLDGAFLDEANLEEAILSKANLKDAVISDADLDDAKLEDADLSEANLEDAILGDVDLRVANLEDANLSNVLIWSEADLSFTNLSGTVFRDASLRGADLRFANLKGADLSSADLKGVVMHGGDLKGSDLSGADLSEADLAGVTVTKKQLKQVKSLKGATMPDGSIHP
jgi:uncharacterized protein YjbI with pentapeptide repeats/NADH:ubiquinone oxidoreductase subunit 3 (subunit A)